MIRLALAALLCATPALAESGIREAKLPPKAVGKVVKLEGSATRTNSDGKKHALKLDSAIESQDMLEVAAKGLLKLELGDGTVIALDEKSRLQMHDAVLHGTSLTWFSATLRPGRIWARVKPVVSGGKFEVKTLHSLSEVRGTIFRIDAEQLIKGAQGRKADVVRVYEGAVRVVPAAEVLAKSKPTASPKDGGTRAQVAGPTQVGWEEWEKKFAELQSNSQLTVGVDLWEQAELDRAALSDRFQKWIDADAK